VLLYYITLLDCFETICNGPDAIFFFFFYHSFSFGLSKGYIDEGASKIQNNVSVRSPKTILPADELQPP